MTHTIARLHRNEADGVLSAWSDRIHTDWPTPAQAPVFIDHRFSDLTTGEGDPVAADAVLIVADQATEAELLKIVDTLRSAGLAGVVIGPERASAPELSSAGVLVRAANTPPCRIGDALAALCSRQEHVKEITQELRIAHKTSGGVRDEMNKMSQELSLAARIQQELIPRELPSPPGLDVGVLFRPAGYVSGDIYNIAQIDDSRVAFFIADAVGHGVPAALLTMIISRSLPMRGGISEGRLITPADALGRLNDELCEVSDGNPRFATAVYGILDFATGMARIANGGHPQPMRIGRRGVDHIEATGPLLGVFHGAEFTEEIIELRSGETLLLYSDGFETAFPNADAVLQANTPAPSRRYLDHLLKIGRWRERGVKTIGEALGDLAGSLDCARGSLHQLDDVTALALARAA
ncbi:MAG: PP2C family protein-serine/threonine phosphatase [Planctomycetota bacterium]